MNRSGLAVKSIVKEGGVSPERVVVVYDDLDIPLGEIRIRKGGGAGGHRGMASIIEKIQTTRFPRIRIGIGPSDPGEDTVDFVLSSFRKEETPFLERSLKLAREALVFILSGETEKAMNVYNKRGRKERQAPTEPVLP
jgi:PTH1 family peptidyl-tRNA hydrolase